MTSLSNSRIADATTHFAGEVSSNILGSIATKASSLWSPIEIGSEPFSSCTTFVLPPIADQLI